MNVRQQVLEQLVDLITAVEKRHPTRVAIDGVDAAGKTFLADELVPLVEGRGRSVIRASIDGFHNRREIRYRQGADSPQGYYQDSFNYAALLHELLLPLGPAGNRKFRPKVFDYRIEQPITKPQRAAPLDAILLFDGVFLLRPELFEHWDMRIFVEVGFDVSVPRAAERDLRNGLGDSMEAIITRYQQRYVPGQRLYFDEAQPKQHADVILDNNKIQSPTIISPSHVRQEARK